MLGFSSEKVIYAGLAKMVYAEDLLSSIAVYLVRAELTLSTKNPLVETPCQFESDIQHHLQF